MSSFPNSFSPQLLSKPAHGITDRPIAYGHAGRVKYRGTYWFAKLYEPDQSVVIPTGAPVTIIGIEGITLLVVPASAF